MSLRVALLGATFMAVGSCLLMLLAFVLYWHENSPLSLLIASLFALIIFGGMMGLWFVSERTPRF